MAGTMERQTSVRLTGRMAEWLEERARALSRETGARVRAADVLRACVAKQMGEGREDGE